MKKKHILQICKQLRYPKILIILFANIFESVFAATALCAEPAIIPYKMAPIWVPYSTNKTRPPESPHRPPLGSKIYKSFVTASIPAL